MIINEVLASLTKLFSIFHFIKTGLVEEEHFELKLEQRMDREAFAVFSFCLVLQ